MITFKEKAQKVINAVGLAANANTPTGVVTRVVVGATTANTRMNVPHGLGFTPRLIACTVVSVGLDDDVVQPSFAIVKTDATNVVVKPSTSQADTAVNFLLIIELDVDVGGRYNATT